MNLKNTITHIPLLSTADVDKRSIALNDGRTLRPFVKGQRLCPSFSKLVTRQGIYLFLFSTIVWFGNLLTVPK
ncbi:hypothetical protein AMECASPLE_005629 [Ameca splendens]|uniref:Uncharacterized protein n=1 Tax=Ameca splendens TaxID=208324 RepID=A0ABV0YYL4_9TELE